VRISIEKSIYREKREDGREHAYRRKIEKNYHERIERKRYIDRRE
jgi:hypothetical protein